MIEFTLFDPEERHFDTAASAAECLARTLAAEANEQAAKQNPLFKEQPE